MKIVLEETIYARQPEVFDAAANEHGFSWCSIQPLEEEKALAYHSAGASVFIIGTKRYSDSFYGALRSGSLIQRFGVGYNSVPVPLCRARGLHVAITPGAVGPAVAEHAIGLMLALSRTFCAFDRDMKAGTWKKIAGVELHGKTLSLIGFGRIARATAHIAKHGLGMRIVAHDIVRGLDPTVAELADEYEPELLNSIAQADYVSLHIPGGPHTAGLVDAKFLSAMKRTAFLINTARGSLIDEQALYEHLQSRQIAGAALDVFAEEPYEPQGGDLRELENCILTPHCASNTDESNSRMAAICVANCVAFASGQMDKLTLLPED